MKRNLISSLLSSTWRLARQQYMCLKVHKQQQTTNLFQAGLVLYRTCTGLVGRTAVYSRLPSTGKGMSVLNTDNNSWCRYVLFYWSWSPANIHFPDFQSGRMRNHRRKLLLLINHLREKMFGRYVTIKVHGNKFSRFLFFFFMVVLFSVKYDLNMLKCTILAFLSVKPHFNPYHLHFNTFNSQECCNCIERLSKDP